MKKTGGGPPPEDLSSLENRVLQLIPSCLIEGIQGDKETPNGKAKGLEKYPQDKVERKEKELFPNSPLHEACRKGNLNRVRHILSQSLVDIYINIKEEKHGRTPLMVAAQEGHCKIAEFLIRKGAKKSDVDNDCNYSFLHWACKGGHLGMVDCLLQQYGVTALYIPPLQQVAWRGFRDVFDFLVCTGSNMSQVDDNGMNVLHWASYGGHVHMVKYIVTQGNFHINSRTKSGVTPLMMAASGGSTAVFYFLVSVGANLSQVNNDGDNILHLASGNGHVKMVKHILSQSLVDINARNKYHKTAAMKAKHRNRIKVYNLLVSQGGAVN